MRRGGYLIFVFSACLIGCHASVSNQPQQPGAPSSVAGAYVLTGPIPGSGPHPLQAGDTISSVLSHLGTKSPVIGTIVLVRRDPEGFRREMIQLAPDGKLMDPKQDYMLRNGDELIFPSQTTGKSGS